MHTFALTWVDWRATPDDGFEFAVADSGIGIAADKLPLLFNRFQQVDNSATRTHSGTGIGLALVKELAELMGGSVGVESVAGQGSRFFVRLSRGTEKLAALADESQEVFTRSMTATESMLRNVRFQEGRHIAPPAREQEIASGAMALPTVLVVDDNPDMRTYIKELLTSECNVISAVHGLDAWDLLQRHRIDVVVSDVMMAELDGLGLTARIKNSPKFSHIPVILVTARGGADASVSGLDTGADDYIAKPFSPAELKARVRAALRMAQVQAQLREKFPKLQKVAQLLQEHADDLPSFIAQDNRGQVLPSFITQSGDAPLNTMSERLQSALRESDTVARLGGDEFVLVIRCPEDSGLTISTLQRIMAIIAEPMIIEERTFSLTCSMGVAVYPIDGETPESLVEHADIAMYRAKESGRDNFQFFTNEMNQRLQERVHLEQALRHALERNEFVLHYQPQVDLRSGRIVGLEALIRWNHPEMGVVSPLRFIGLAEECGLIGPIGTWVIRTACIQNKAWQNAGLPSVRIAVNLSSRLAHYRASRAGLAAPYIAQSRGRHGRFALPDQPYQNQFGHAGARHPHTHHAGTRPARAN